MHDLKANLDKIESERELKEENEIPVTTPESGHTGGDRMDDDIYMQVQVEIAVKIERLQHRLHTIKL